VSGESEDHEAAGTENIPWRPVTGRLAPAEAIALAAALESAGLRVLILQPESERSLPTVPILHGPEPAFANHQLAVPEDQVEQAGAVLARARQAVAQQRTSAMPPAVLEEQGQAPVFSAEEDALPLAPRLAEPRAEDLVEHARRSAFERARVRRFIVGVVVFVAGATWAWFTVSRVNEFILFQVGGVVVLAAGLLTIYSALSMREEDEEDGEPPQET
jgi:uncharacterized protein GlcG (DUF336 family)